MIRINHSHFCTNVGTETVSREHALAANVGPLRSVQRQIQIRGENGDVFRRSPFHHAQTKY